MSTHHESNLSSPSTTWGFRRVKIGVAPQADSHSRPKGVARQALARRDPRKPLTVTIVYRGGSECWWEIRSRGVVLRRPGYWTIHDVFSLLEGERSL
jgi:hypothetical protein